HGPDRKEPGTVEGGQQGQDTGGRRGQYLGPDQQPPPVEPVGQPPSVQSQYQDGREGQSLDRPHVPRPSGQLQNQNALGDVLQPRSRARDDVSDEEQPEVPVTQWRQGPSGALCPIGSFRPAVASAARVVLRPHSPPRP